MNETIYDYGQCHICGKQMAEKQINQEFWIKGSLIVIESIPAGVCTQCGEKVVKADIGQQIGLLLTKTNKLQPARNINVPVFEFKAAT